MIKTLRIYKRKRTYLIWNENQPIGKAAEKERQRRIQEEDARERPYEHVPLTQEKYIPEDREGYIAG
jgi:hypothetical protein